MPNLKRDDEPGEEEFWLEQNMSKLKISKWGLSKGQAAHLPACPPPCQSARLPTTTYNNAIVNAIVKVFVRSSLSPSLLFTRTKAHAQRIAARFTQNLRIA